MLDLAISVDTDRNGTTIIETNHGVRLKAPNWPQDCEFQLVVFTPSAGTCQVISAEQLADDIRKALAALENVGVLKPRKADWHRRLHRYAEGAGKLQPPIDLRHSSAANVASILAAAQERNQVGPVAQHVVGAKLALRFPNVNIDNFSYSAADAAANRPGDFVVNRSVFHVTMTPSILVLRKCKRNLKDGYRPVLLVPDDRKAGAAQMAESMGLGPQLAILAIEAFVGQNIEEMAEFKEFERLLRRLLEIYNGRVAQAEPDPSLQIEIPDRLGR